MSRSRRLPLRYGLWLSPTFSTSVDNNANAGQNEIFVYDRLYVSEPETNIDIAEIPPPEPLRPEDPPDTLANQNDLQAWRSLYMARRSWALNLSERCQSIDHAIQENKERTDIINQAVGVALENLKSHVGSLENRFQDAQQWASDLLKEQRTALDGWQRSLTTLDRIPARLDFYFLGRTSTPRTDKDRSTGTLCDYVDVDEVQRAGSEASATFPRFVNQVNSVEGSVSDIASDTQRLLDGASPASVDGAGGLIEEVETIAKKVSSDYEHVLGLPNNQKTLANISRLALSHTQDLLPSLLDISVELQSGLEEAVRARNAAMRYSIRHMQKISSIESRLANAQSQIANLDLRSDAFDIIFSVFHMPMAYGSVLIESVRRREWSEKMKSDSLTLAEEMAVFRDEEQRRRKKWLKSMGDFISLPDSATPGIEVNLQGREHEWPEVSRKEIEAYIEELKSKPAMSTIIQDLLQLYKELDAPTRQQRRKAKAFKQGSVVDMGRSSLLVRGDDMVRSLRDEKSKLEDKLKGSDSRIRKLEDLLHRQSHLSRPPSGHFGPDFPSSPASAHPDQLSRRSSVSSRRMSSNHSSEEKVLAQRLSTVEAELSTERETVQRLFKEIQSERQSHSDKYQEAQDTKQDLIKNLESQQGEFQDERKLLNSEVKKFTIRVEELEEELDKTMDNRDQEKHVYDEQIQQLVAEIQSAHAKVEELNGANEEMRSEKEKFDEIQKQSTETEKRYQENYNILQSAFMNLSPGSSVPVEVTSIIKAIDVLSEGLSIHARNAEESANKAAAEINELEERISRMESEAEESKKTLAAREHELSRLTEDLLLERSKLSTMTSELNEQKSKLSSLQSQVASGETGSDALRERVAEGEQKLADMSNKLGEAEAQARRSGEEISEWKKQVEPMSELEQRTATQIQARGERSSELSKRLFSQVERLGLLLEQLGFVVIRQNGKLVVQRASKVNASSHGDILNQPDVVDVKPNAEFLDWMLAPSAEEEAARFKAFIDSLAQFDINIVGEAIVKRVKDIELLARKWQKEAKAYRDKYHRAQGEAHEKIAYRSFKEGDLALFLPTRNQAIRSWAAFNVGAPHYFLREQDAHKLHTRDWLLARITKVEERVVDLSKSMNSGGGLHPDRRSIGGDTTSDGASFDDENPFELSDGLRWYLVDAVEEKPGAPATPGLGKSTVASANVDARGSIRLQRTLNGGTVAKKLTRSLDSRRNSSTSKKDASSPSSPLAEASRQDLGRSGDAGSQPRETVDDARRGSPR